MFQPHIAPSCNSRIANKNRVFVLKILVKKGYIFDSRLELESFPLINLSLDWLSLLIVEMSDSPFKRSQSNNLTVPPDKVYSLTVFSKD